MSDAVEAASAGIATALLVFGSIAQYMLVRYAQKCVDDIFRND